MRRDHQVARNRAVLLILPSFSHIRRDFLQFRIIRQRDGHEKQIGRFLFGLRRRLDQLLNLSRLFVQRFVVEIVDLVRRRLPAVHRVAINGRVTGQRQPGRSGQQADHPDKTT